MKLVGTEVFWPWYTLIGATITLVTAWLLRWGMTNDECQMTKE